MPLLRYVSALLCLAFAAIAETGTDRIYERLRFLGYGENVARAIANRRADLHPGLLEETTRNVPAAESKYRPVVLYRGMEMPLESYDAKTGRGRTMTADGARWMTSLLETATFYAGLTGVKRPGHPEILNRGVVLEMEIPYSLLGPGGTPIAVGVKLDAVPDESVFATRVGLGRYLPERDPKQPGLLTHAELKKVKGELPPLITWFPAAEAFNGTRLRLPAWVEVPCNHRLSGLGTPLPMGNPHF